MSSTSTSAVSAVDLIGNVDSNNASTPLTQAPLGESDFLQIMLTQLTYQDPLKPMDNEAFIAQMAQFTTLELQNELNGKVNTLVSTQAMSQSFNLMGKQVTFNNTTTASTAAQGPLTGKVTTITIQNGTPSLTVAVGSGTGATTVSNVTLANILAIVDTATTANGQ